ncbi:MAG: MarR family transcriptional regulator [Lachnospiraceae bacterium]|nr:MarR family transcriptional regulator [Lachnospiraceae bacterium]
MADEDTVFFDESILLSFPLMHRLLHVAYDGEQKNLTKTQFIILISLYLYGELPMMELSKLSGITKEQATRALSPLAENGLVTRSISESNRNYVYVHLSPHGKARVRAMFQRCSKRLDSLAEVRLTPEELKELGQHMTALRLLLNKITNKSCPV